MSNRSNKKASTGVRYTAEEKKNIVDFVVSHNLANGRGGQSAASKKFKVTPLTISAWLKASGAAPKGKAKKAAKVAKATKPAKASKPAKSAGKTKKGMRYSAEQKQEVVDFVSSYNSSNGRGGQSQAAKKFTLSVLTVSSWLKNAGVKGGAKSKVVKAAKGKKVAATAGRAAAPAGLAAKVASLVDINEQVRQAEVQLEKLYTKHDSIMASIKGWI
jgi:transposase-like protein